jgi:hypothetical protein
VVKSTYKTIGDKIRHSGFVIPLFWALVAGCLIVVITTVNDYYTSLRGVERLYVNQTLPNPTQFELTLAALRRHAIAGMPQVVSIVMGMSILAYVPVKGTKQEKMLWTMGLLFFLSANYIDINTGYHYYIPTEWENVPIFVALQDPMGRKAVLDAWLMSAGVDTLLSEILGAFFWGLLFEIYPDFFKQWSKVRGKKESISEMVARDQKKSKKRKGTPPPRSNVPPAPPRASDILRDEAMGGRG